MALHGGCSRSAARSSCSATTCAASVRLAALERGQGHLLVDPRLGRRRRGRPDAPAGRAPRRAAGHARPARDPPGRRQRDGRRPGASPSTTTGPTALSSAARTCRCSRAPTATTACARGAYVLARRRTTADPDVVLIGTGSEVSRVRRRRRRCWPPTASRARVVSHAVLGAVRRAGRRLPATSAARRGARRCRSRPAASFGWDRWADDSVGIDHFGASAPGRGRARAARLHRRATSPSRGPRHLLARRSTWTPTDRRHADDRAPATCIDEQGQSPGSTTSSAARSPAASCSGWVDARRPGHHVEPDDLPEGDRGRRPTTTSSSGRSSATARSSSDAYWDLVIDRHRRRARRSCARLRRERRRRRLRLGRGRARPGPRHRRHHRRGPRICTSAIDRAQPVS